MTPILAFTTPGHTTLGLLMAVVAIAFTRRFAIRIPRQYALAFIGLTVLAHNAPDLDALTYLGGYTHQDFWGHRGVFHSYTVGGLFGALLGITTGKLIRVQPRWNLSLALTCWFVLGTWMHVTADMLCDCEEKVMWAWPLSTERLLFAFRPIPRFTFDLADGSVWQAFMVELQLIVPFSIICISPLGFEIAVASTRRLLTRRSIQNTPRSAAVVS